MCVRKNINRKTYAQTIGWGKTLKNAEINRFYEFYFFVEYLICIRFICKAIILKEIVNVTVPVFSINIDRHIAQERIIFLVIEN